MKRAIKSTPEQDQDKTKDKIETERYWDSSHVWMIEVDKETLKWMGTDPVEHALNTDLTTERVHEPKIAYDIQTSYALKYLLPPLKLIETIAKRNGDDDILVKISMGKTQPKTPVKVEHKGGDLPILIEYKYVSGEDDKKIATLVKMWIAPRID